MSPEKYLQSWQNQIKIKQNTNGDYLLKDGKGKATLCAKI